MLIVVFKDPAEDKTTPDGWMNSKFSQAFVSLTAPGFRTLWFGMLFSMASMQINLISRSWLAYDLSGSGLILGAVAIARGLPQIIFSPLGGVAADRFDKRKLLIASQSTLFVLALTNAVLVHLGVIQIWHLVVIGVFQGLVFPFTMPARQALIPQLAGQKNLTNALAVDSTGRNLNRVLAPSLAGLLIAWHPTIAFYAVAVLYFLAVITLLRLPSAERTIKPQRSVLEQMMFGFKYIIGQRRLLILIVMGFLIVTLGLPFQQMLPVFQVEVLKVGPAELGFLYAAVGVGALLGSLVMAYRSNDPRRQRFQLISGVCFGALLIPFAFSGILWLSLLLLVMLGFFSETYMTINRMMVLLNTDSRLYGRVMGVYGITWSLMPIATLPIGALVDIIGVSRTIAGVGLLLAIAILILSLILPRIWDKNIPAPA